MSADRAATVLPHLVPAHVTGTREDLLPYMRPAMKAVNEYFYARLIALPAIRDYLEGIAASASA